MIYRFKKSLIIVGVVVAVFCNPTFAQKQLFPEVPGVVSYTFRTQFAKDVPGTLDMLKALGIMDIEFSSLFKQTPENLRKMCDLRGIKCSSYGVSYDDLIKKTDEVGKVAQILGASYIRVSSIPYKGTFGINDAKRAVDNFNKYGKILKKNYGLTFIYHNHGFEYQPYQNGTLYDYLLKHTSAKYVGMELDILWAFLPGQDPAQLLNKYGNRYKALHLKDLKKGVERGSLSGSTAKDNDVILGTGQIDIEAVIKAARKAGVKHYYIEDESSSSVAQVPESIKYVNSLKQD
ncbi:MAG TPA: sugar phosphate isomerase/epimerase [Pelobium sp.]|nr:sugar phosphate isomerase/epimerase [Pelobium sp.]